MFVYTYITNPDNLKQILLAISFCNCGPKFHLINFRLIKFFHDKNSNIYCRCIFLRNQAKEALERDSQHHFKKIIWHYNFAIVNSKIIWFINVFIINELLVGLLFDIFSSITYDYKIFKGQNQQTDVYLAAVEYEFIKFETMQCGKNIFLEVQFLYKKDNQNLITWIKQIQQITQLLR